MDTAMRLAEMELRYTEQARMIDELSAVLFQQQKELDAVKAELKLMKRKVDEFDPGLVEAGRVEKPPHY